ncbi:MAG TPA: alcohol dehydrogenase catalytic domain-containing protein [Chloroflexota bacterium]|nr:alcohol dehydrogenase catalytic domain-containing protein [Chloroflexota bacterium]
MLQSQWTEQGIVLRDVEPPPLSNGWVRLSVAACGICGSDLHTYRHGAAGRSVPGHELVGTVLAGPAGLADALYAVEPWLACGSCDFCLAGQRQHCRQGKLLGAQVNGGLAEFVDAPASEVHPIPVGLTPLLASMAEPLAVCVRAVHRAELKLDSRVLIIGGGSIGLLAGMLARDASARVAISTRHAHQEQVARQLGVESVAEAHMLAFAQDFQPDVVFESVGGTAPTVGQAMQACRAGGRVVVLGLFSGPSEIDARTLIMKELTLRGSKVYGTSEHGHEFRAAVDLLPRYRQELSRLQTHQFPLADLKAAFAGAADKSTRAIKVTVLMPT